MKTTSEKPTLRPNARRTVLAYAIGLRLTVVLTACTMLSACSTTRLAKQTLSVAQTAASRPVINYAKLPLSFEVNRGQADPQVKFLSRARGYTLFLTPTESVMTLRKRVEDRDQTSEIRDRSRKLSGSGSEVSATVRMTLVGADPNSQMTGLEKLPGIVNYFIGNDPAKWRTEIPTFAKVKYKKVYPGVDVVYYGNQGRLEHDFVVAPGADASVIQVAFEGVDKMETDAQGELVLHVGAGELRLGKPEIYQMMDGVRQPIVGSYALKGWNQVGFEVAAYDARQPLVIDPVLWYSTYLGGNSDDSASSIAVDAAANAYVTGFTESDDFPVRHALQRQFAGGGADIFVTKFSATSSAGQTPTHVYSTYLGGASFDEGNGIAVDGAGNAYVAGYTESTDFPKTANAVQRNYGGGTGDAVVVKLNADGSSLLYSTFLGGSSEDEPISIAVDANGLAYVAGDTRSVNFPTQNAFQGTFRGDICGFVAKIDPQRSGGNSLLYSTFLGGGKQGITCIAVDATGNAYVTGHSGGGIPATPDAFQLGVRGGVIDAFVTKFSASGSLLYSSYLGGNSSDVGSGIAVDQSGFYVTGGTSSTDFPTKSFFFSQPFQRTLKGDFDAFVAKFARTSSGAIALFYSTYLGGSGSDSGRAITVPAVNTTGVAYVAGFTSSADFPKVNAIDVTFAGSSEAFVTEMRAFGNSLIFSTYLGGSGFEETRGIAVQGVTNVYVLGETTSTDFSTLAAPQPNHGGGSRDGFLTKIGRITQPVSLLGLLDLVNNLGLPEAQQLSLTAILVKAQEQLDELRTRPAAGLLRAFIAQVDALQQSGRLDAPSAEQLLAATEAIIDDL